MTYLKPAILSNLPVGNISTERNSSQHRNTVRCIAIRAGSEGAESIGVNKCTDNLNQD